MRVISVGGNIPASIETVYVYKVNDMSSTFSIILERYYQYSSTITYVHHNVHIVSEPVTWILRTTIARADRHALFCGPMSVLVFILSQPIFNVK